MAKGREKHQARLDAVQQFGKDLARRARSRCELCEDSDQVLIHDTDPEGKTPSMDSLLMLCARCRALLAGRQDDPRTLRFLETAVWSETPIVAQTAKRLLRTVDAPWARQALELAGD